MELRSQSVRDALDGVPLGKKVTGWFATVEIGAYPDGHAAFAGHPLNGRDELLSAVAYLFDRLYDQAKGSTDIQLKGRHLRIA
jgi:hypothetical protein